MPASPCSCELQKPGIWNFSKALFYHLISLPGKISFVHIHLLDLHFSFTFTCKFSTYHAAVTSPVTLLVTLWVASKVHFPVKEIFMP